MRKSVERVTYNIKLLKKSKNYKGQEDIYIQRDLSNALKLRFTKFEKKKGKKNL